MKIASFHSKAEGKGEGGNISSGSHHFVRNPHATQSSRTRTASGKGWELKERLRSTYRKEKRGKLERVKQKEPMGEVMGLAMSSDIGGLNAGVS